MTQDNKILQDELDLFIRKKQVIALIEKLNIPEDFYVQSEPVVVLGNIFSNYDDDFIPELDKRIREIKKKPSLGEYIEELIRKKNIKHYSELHMRAGVSKEYWHKIIKGKIKNPSKAKLLCIAFALKLNLEETEKLLRIAGYSFTKDLTVLDAIFAYFIEKGNYNIIEIDIQLERYNQPTIYSIK